jgi:hypothetical protein
MLDRFAGRMMDLDSPAYGDERERAVVMEASSFGLLMGLYAGLLSALLASVFGFVLLPVILLVGTILPLAAALWYAKRRGVSMEQLTENTAAKSTMVHTVVFGAVGMLTFAAMTYTVFTGLALLPLSHFDVTSGEGAWVGAIRGGVIGGMLGSLATIIGGTLSFRRAHRHSDESHH